MSIEEGLVERIEEQAKEIERLKAENQAVRERFRAFVDSVIARELELSIKETQDG